MKERLSAFMDDSLGEDSAATLFDRLRSDNDAVRAWHTYHLIGDSIRGHGDLHANLVAKVMSRIESEPAVLAPVPRRSASTSRLRWALPLAASVMGVGAVAWVSQSLKQEVPSTESIARVAPLPVTGASTFQPGSVASVGLIDPALQTLTSGVAIPVQTTFGREYLIAHQAYAPGSKMSGVAQYVRTVSESRDELAR
jgi:sigma-E factor negative regulatory protein RseA